MSENRMEESTGVKPYKSFCIGHTGPCTDVYIVNRAQLAQAERVKKEDDILVLDDRTAADPNMQIRDSYKITAQAAQEAVIRILLEYNEEFPTDPAWNRTFKSLDKEWDLHNFAHLLGILPKRTGDVDFNNGDEWCGILDYVRKV